MPSSVHSMSSDRREPMHQKVLNRNLPPLALDLKANPGHTFSGPPSPTLTATTQASQLGFGDTGPRVVLTRWVAIGI